MIKYIIVLSLIISSINAIDLNDMMKIVRKNSKDLSVVAQNIKIANENMKLVTKWDNPILGLGINDIHLNNITSRDLEAMQSQYISISQTIPTNSKLEIKENIQRKNSEVYRLLLKDKILKIESILREYLSKRVVILEKLQLINSYLANISQLNTLYKELAKIDVKNHRNYVNSDILYSNLLIQKENLNSQLKIIKLQIEKILYKKIYKISFGLQAPLRVKKINILHHPFIISKQESINRENYNIKLQYAKEVPDMKLNAGYFNRIDREDYISLSLSMPLTINGREKINIQKAKILKMQKYDELEISKNSFRSEIKILREIMKSSYKNYTMIKSQILPQKEHIKEMLHSDILSKDIGSDSVINSINEVIKEELLGLNELDRYYNAYSKLTYFKGAKR